MLQQRQRYRVELLTTRYLMRGEMEPIGPILVYLNDRDRATITFYNIEVIALEAGNAMGRFRADELMIRRQHIIALRLIDAVDSQVLALMARHIKLRVFTQGFVVQGDFHCGADVRAQDLFDVIRGEWATATNVVLHSLMTLKRPPFDNASVLLLRVGEIVSYQILPEATPPPAVVPVPQTVTPVAPPRADPYHPTPTKPVPPK